MRCRFCGKVCHSKYQSCWECYLTYILPNKIISELDGRRKRRYSVGSIVWRPGGGGNFWIKISDEGMDHGGIRGEWRRLALVVLENIYGVLISSKTTIRFRDGNRRNCHPSNLLLPSVHGTTAMKIQFCNCCGRKVIRRNKYIRDICKWCAWKKERDRKGRNPLIVIRCSRCGENCKPNSVYSFKERKSKLCYPCIKVYGVKGVPPKYILTLKEKSDALNQIKRSHRSSDTSKPRKRIYL